MTNGEIIAVLQSQTPEAEVLVWDSGEEELFPLFSADVASGTIILK